MLRPTPPAAAAAALLALAAVGAAAPAHADPGSFLGRVECGSSGGRGCTVRLDWWSSHGGSAGSGPTQGGTGTQTGSGGDTAAPAGDGIDYSGIDWETAVDWSQVPWHEIDWESIDYGDGEGEEGEEGRDPVDPVTLIQESMASFELPPPEIETSPGPDSLVLVNTPVWLWVDSRTWAPESASAEVPGWSLEVTATPVTTTWTLGDGTRIECDGPGTPYDPAVHAPDTASPDCGHVYTRSSAGSAGGTYTVTVEVAWDTAWEFSDGASGELNQVSTVTQVELEVAESQGLVTGAGPRQQ